MAVLQPVLRTQIGGVTAVPLRPDVERKVSGEAIRWPGQQRNEMLLEIGAEHLLCRLPVRFLLPLLHGGHRMVGKPHRPRQT